MDELEVSVVSIVRKTCDRLFILATSSGDEIVSLRRLTHLLELQRMWENGKEIGSGGIPAEKSVTCNKILTNQEESSVVDIMVCHDCGASTTGPSQTTYKCNLCGLVFLKCLSLMRHLLVHNTVNCNNGSTLEYSDGHCCEDQGQASIIVMVQEETRGQFTQFPGVMSNAGDKKSKVVNNIKIEDGSCGSDDCRDNSSDNDDVSMNKKTVMTRLSQDSVGKSNHKTEKTSNSNELKKKKGSSSLNCSSKTNSQVNTNSTADDGSLHLPEEEGCGIVDSSKSVSSRYSFFPRLECPACGQTFRRTGSLKNHMATHTTRGPFFSHAPHRTRKKPSLLGSDKGGSSDPPVLCCECGKQFASLKRLRVHALSHSSPGRFSCDKCPMKFSIAASLKRHLQRHTGIRAHVCSQCGKSFVRADELAAHEKLHFNRNRFPCPVCKKGFTRHVDMLRHQSCHETSRPYQCEMCQKSFVRHDFLVKHRSTHLSRACPFCNEVFNCRRNMTLHIKKEHPEKSVEDLFKISKSKLTDGAQGDDRSFVSMLEFGAFSPLIGNEVVLSSGDMQEQLQHIDRLVHLQKEGNYC